MIIPLLSSFMFLFNSVTIEWLQLRAVAKTNIKAYGGLYTLGKWINSLYNTLFQAICTLCSLNWIAYGNIDYLVQLISLVL